MKYLILIIMFLAACGTDDSKEPSTAQEVTGKTPYSMALQTADEMPECVAENQNQLIYIIDDKIFFTCDDGEWVEINIGMDQDPEVNTNESALFGSFWLDQKTGVKWYVMGQTTNQKYNCTDWTNPNWQSVKVFEWNVPSAEIKEALTNGIFKELNIRVWVDTYTYVYSQFPSVEYVSSSTVGEEYGFSICKLN